MNRFLLDSHTHFWAAYAPQKLPARVRDILADPRNMIFASHVSTWEMINKASRSKLPFVSSTQMLFDGFMSLGAIEVSVELEDIRAASELPHFHHDPFDRILIAQAMRLNATLLSKDAVFKLYDVPVIWK